MHVLFGLNGTLLDAGALTAGWPGAGRGAGLRALDDTVAQSMVDMITGHFRPFPEYLRASLTHLAVIGGLPGEAVDAAMLVARALPPFPDAAQALQDVRAAGHVPVVLTNSAAETAAEGLRAGGLHDHVERVLGADAVEAYKPDARVYTYALEALGAAAADTWMVAAHWWDVAGAKRAGLRTAWVGRDEGALLATVPKPDVLASDLAEAAAKIVASPPP